MNKITFNLFLTKRKKSIKTVFSFCMAFIVSQSSWAQVSLPHYDGLNYTVGESLAAQTAAGWALSSASTSDLLITSGSLTYASLASSTGGKLSFSSGGEDAAKAFTNTGTTVYCSYIMNITDVTTVGAFTSGYFAALSTTANTASPGTASQSAAVWVRASSGGFNIGFSGRANQTTVGSTPTSLQYTSTVYPLGTPVFVVISHEKVVGSGNDICKLWINPTPGMAEPAYTFLVTTATDLADVSNLFIKQNGSTSTPTMEMDEIRLGTTFSSVTPISWNGTVWSNTTGTTAVADAIITGVYSTSANGEFTAKNITINSGSLTVNSGTNITVTDALVNNLTASNVIVENNANILQSGTTNTNSGAITVKRTTNPLMLLDYVMWGSPVATQQLQAFSPATLSNRFYSYNSATNLYSAETATNNFADGKGYLIRMPNDHPTTPTSWVGSFVGVPHSGDYTFTPDVGFNSVANPYPSTLSMTSFVADNPTITGTLYFWRKTNSTTILPGYCSWNSGTYVSNGQPGALATGNNMLQVGQGFIVKANSATGVLFKNTQRTGNNAGQTYKSSVNITTASADEKNRVWLNLTSADGGFSQTAFGYMTNATNEVDSYDGENFNDGNLSISSLIADQKFVIQGKALPFENTDLVPLNYKVSQAGSYTIAIDNVDGLFANNAQAVYLRDTLLNTETNLSSTAYTFASATGEFNNRFVVAYTPQTLGNPQFNANSVIVYKNNNNVVVNSGNTAMESVKVFDLTGRLLLDKNNINDTVTTLSVAAQNQVILVQVKDISGNTVSKKVIN